MGVDNQFEPLASGEVLSVDESAQILIGHHTFRVGELADALKTQLEYGLSEWTQDKDAWFSEEGISCEVLRFSSSGWQKGKVRINLEFCPQVAEDEEPVKSVSGEDESEDEFALADSSTTMDQELDLQQPSMSLDEEEYELSAFSDEEQQQDRPSDIYDEMEQRGATFQMEELEQEEPPFNFEDDFEEMSPSAEETSVSFEDDFDELSGDEEDTSASFGDDFDELSQSIEEELEMEEESTSNDEELLDLGAIATESDEELDFGQSSASDEDEFDLSDLSSSFEEEENDNDTDSLLDDVWQEMSQESWRSNQ
ncbi:MAG: KGK domain-containing protein [Coleofasciculus sp. G1-WW12-02]|uniref:KGK domain-containing protein n=1 Tax=Coleofasciculus sp. G1-WW12-02 TaxID=3068483 RepID=UPI0032F8B2EE